MNAYEKAYYISFVAAMLCVSGAPCSSLSQRAQSPIFSAYQGSFIFGSTWNINDPNEVAALINLMSMIEIWSFAVGYYNVSVYWGGTIPSNIQSALESNSSFPSIYFYYSHGGTASISGHTHWFVVDANGNPVYDENIYPWSGGQHAEFVMIQSCDQGDVVGGTYSDNSAYGMPFAWLHTNMSSSGYFLPDDGNYAFIGWNGAAPFLTANWTNQNLEDAYNFLKDFYFAALLQGSQFSINRALDFAAFAVWGVADGVSFGTCPFENGPQYGYGSMTVYGDGNLDISDYSTLPICGMKTETNGYFYVPIVAPGGFSRLKIEELFFNQSFTGDQAGGPLLYDNTIPSPDGNVDGKDIALIAKSFDTAQGDPGWNYMADVGAFGEVDGRDITIAARNFGNSGYQYLNFTQNYASLEGSIAVVFNWPSGEYLPTTVCNPNGYVQIPSDATNFTVEQFVQGNYVPIGAMVTFWSP
jgi:hypothetical protein